MRLLHTLAVLALFCFALAIAGCKSLEINDSDSFDTAKKGIIEVRVTDAPPEYDLASIDIVFSTVEIHKTGDGEGEGGWIQIPVVNGQLDLIELDNLDLEELLATELVTPGTYNQLRVIIDTISVTLAGDGDAPYVFIPSGELKFNQHFLVLDDIATILLLDFDASESMVVTGSGRIIFSPVVHLSVNQE